MKSIFKQFRISLLFCLIFIISALFFSVNIYADNFGISPDDSTLYGTLRWHFMRNSDLDYLEVDTSKGLKVENLLKTVREVYCSKYQECADKKFENLEIVDKITITYGSSSSKKEIPLISEESDYKNIFEEPSYDSKSIFIDFKIGDNSSYKFESFVENIDCIVGHDTKGNTIIGTISKIDADGENSDGESYASLNGWSETDVKNLIFKGKVSENTQKFLKDLSNAGKLGLIAGSVGSGYNVGTVYSTSQKALSTIMEKQANGTYDFKNLNSLRTTFSYYMSPLLGKMEFGDGKKYEEKPTNLESWTKLVSDISITSGYSIILNSEFTAFDSGLSMENINNEGLKITDDVSVRNGIKAVTGINKSSNPKTVLSYTMKIAYPYAFYRVGDNYKLHARNLRIDPDYEYCISNDYIYPSDMFNGGNGTGDAKVKDFVTNRAELNIERSQLYLFYQMNSDGSYIGVVLIGAFDECVINTKRNTEKNEPLYYATGRKIGFTNGYSDLLQLNTANFNLMYATREGGKEGYLPKNVAFLCSEEEQKVLENNLGVTPEMISQGKKEYMQFNSLSSDEIEDELKEIKNHPLLPEEPQFIKFNIMLMELRNEAAISEFKNSSNSNLSEEEIENLGFTHWAVVIVRNNQYINDSSLKSWLGTQTAKSLTFVDAQGLLNKITGDFVSSLDKLTYGDWKEMQRIKSELLYDKDMWIVRVFNVVSLVLGIFLIVFAILICLAYWVDIFNTFSNFSILYFISFGHLYSVEDKELIPYVGVESGNIKYVTFKDVLLIALLYSIIGVLFLNVNTVVGVIINIYYYILYVLGGK